MIKTFKVQGDRLTELQGLHELNAGTDIGWIDLLSPTAEEDRAVEDLLQISIPTRDDMQEIEPSARLYDEDGADYLTMLAVSLVHIDDPVKCPVTFILHGNIVVTVRYNEFLSISSYIQLAKKKNGVMTPTAQGLMLDIIESFVNRIADSLESLGSEIDRISYDIFRSKKISIQRKNDLLQLSIRKTGAKGDLLSMLRESLTSIGRLLTHYSGSLPDNLPKHVDHKIALLERDVISLADHAGFLSGKMNFLLDATLGMINLEQNQIIKIFSIAAVVFLPPTLVASIYGMNFRHMPELNWEYGYPMALCLMVISAIIPLAYFNKKGWL
jgi:magnesium transporter